MARRRDITRADLLAETEALWLQRGYQGFSIRDVGEAVGISSASVHHHFPTKSDLAAATLARYRDGWNTKLAAIGAEHEDWPSREQAVQLAFANQGLQPGAVCLLAIACADHPLLPEPAQQEVRALYENMTGWLARFVTEAKRREELSTDLSPGSEAARWLAELQGKLLLGRSRGL